MCEKRKERKERSKMAALATPKKNSYIVKESSAKQIVNSKTSQREVIAIKENADLFSKNNLRKEK